MLTLRPSHERGHANHGWLDSRFSFSFADYYDPAHMGFRALRVINQDIVAPQMGFGKHPHRDMEILSYVLAGQVQHEDSMGSREVLRPGELQHMSAGSGVRHSEMNPSPTEPFHMLQIWLLPNQLGVPPKYEQKAFPVLAEPDRLHLLATGYPDLPGRAGAFHLHADAELLAATLSPGAALTHTFRGQFGWLQAVRGHLQVGNLQVSPGDGVKIEHEDQLSISAHDSAELLLFDLT